jgi:hypothetical protein
VNIKTAQRRFAPEVANITGIGGQLRRNPHYDRNDCIWRVPIPEIRRIFYTTAEDYPDSMRMVFNAKKGDYDILTN